MKSTILKLCICAFVFSSLVISKEKLQTDSSKYTFLNTLEADVLGEATSDGGLAKGAITYALGSSGGYVLSNDSVLNYIYSRDTKLLKWLNIYQKNSIYLLQDLKNPLMNYHQSPTIMMDHQN
jgi:hypothetical protein